LYYNIIIDTMTNVSVLVASSIALWAEGSGLTLY